MKKLINYLLIICVTLCLPFGFASCKKQLVIAIPNDTTNESRALLLLQEHGIITLKDGTDVNATVRDIIDNPYDIKFEEIEAALLPAALNDVDFAVINSNYAIAKGLNPVKDAFFSENDSSPYSNVVAVKAENKDNALIAALIAALSSSRVADFIAKKYNGAVISVVQNFTDGYDKNVDYPSLSGRTLSVAASPTPHAEILKIAKEILAEKDITLKIIEFTDYVQPNVVVASGEVDANYFQHLPFLKDFNQKNDANLVSVGAIHVEPLGLYGGKQKSLAVFGL